MNAPAAGWNPDPTGRHEHRYWDGTTWTDDVADGGVASVDPVAGGAPAGDPTAVADATRPMDATQPYTPQQTAFGTPPGPAPHGGYGPSGAPAQVGSGQVPPAQPPRSGPSTALIVGLAALAVALIAGITFVLVSDDGDDDVATDETSATSDDTAADDATDDATDDAADDTADDTDDIGGEISDDAFVGALAAGLEEGAGGQITTEQAECAAEAMLDEIGLEGLIEIGNSGEDPFTSGTLTSEQQAAIITAMTDCIPADVLMDMGADG